VKARVPFASLGLAATVALWSGAAAQTPGAAPSAPQLTVPPASDGPTPIYDRKGRRDPFEPVQTLQPNMTSPTIAAAQLRGILRGQTPRVLVETPDGLGYILAVGDVLAEGRLIEIGVDSVVFSVPARGGSGTDRFVLRLPGD
jgi:hypothetical protein